MSNHKTLTSVLQRLYDSLTPDSPADESNRRDVERARTILEIDRVQQARSYASDENDGQAGTESQGAAADTFIVQTDSAGRTRLQIRSDAVGGEQKRSDWIVARPGEAICVGVPPSLGCIGGVLTFKFRRRGEGPVKEEELETAPRERLVAWPRRSISKK